jgi:hypothetical protein
MQEIELFWAVRVVFVMEVLQTCISCSSVGDRSLNVQCSVCAGTSECLCIVLVLLAWCDVIVHTHTAANILQLCSRVSLSHALTTRTSAVNGTLQ